MYIINDFTVDSVKDSRYNSKKGRFEGFHVIKEKSRVSTEISMS